MHNQIRTMDWMRYLLAAILLYFIESSLASSSEKPLSSQCGCEDSYAESFHFKRLATRNILDAINSQTNYESKYRTIDELIKQSLTPFATFRQTLLHSVYDPAEDQFPSQDPTLVRAVAGILEHVCIFGEIIIHNPIITIRVLNTIKSETGVDWKGLLNWSIEFSRHFHDTILDATDQKLLSLLDQEINPDRRTDDYINPYRGPKKSQTLAKKKRKRGPPMIRDEL